METKAVYYIVFSKQVSVAMDAILFILSHHSLDEDEAFFE
jgi:hypothetical protein